LWIQGANNANSHVPRTCGGLSHVASHLRWQCGPARDGGLRLDLSAGPGMSGSPILNSSGGVIGVLSGMHRPHRHPQVSGPLYSSALLSAYRRIGANAEMQPPALPARLIAMTDYAETYPGLRIRTLSDIARRTASAGPPRDVYQQESGRYIVSYDLFPVRVAVVREAIDAGAIVETYPGRDAPYWRLPELVPLVIDSDWFLRIDAPQVEGGSIRCLRDRLRSRDMSSP
jgi:hypothetical protein